MHDGPGPVTRRLRVQTTGSGVRQLLWIYWANTSNWLAYKRHTAQILRVRAPSKQIHSRRTADGEAHVCPAWLLLSKLAALIDFLPSVLQKCPAAKYLMYQLTISAVTSLHRHLGNINWISYAKQVQVCTKKRSPWVCVQKSILSFNYPSSSKRSFMCFFPHWMQYYICSQNKLVKTWKDLCACDGIHMQFMLRDHWENMWGEPSENYTMLIGWLMP